MRLLKWSAIYLILPQILQYKRISSFSTTGAYFSPCCQNKNSTEKFSNLRVCKCTLSMKKDFWFYWSAAFRVHDDEI